MEKKSLLIVGAGISGLMAAYLLCDKFDITLVEAQARIGGRIQTLYDNDDVIEAGPEFVHGDARLSLGLLRKANISVEETAGQIYRHINNGLVPEKENIEGWDALLKAMKAIEADMSLEEFLDKSYPEPDDEIRREIISYAAGFDLADASTASTKKLYLEWSSEDEADHRIPGGYSKLTSWLSQSIESKGVITYLNEVVNHVDWSNDNIITKTRIGNEFHSTKILITVPILLLGNSSGEGRIKFKPVIEHYNLAAGRIGFGAVIKVVLFFNKSFWKEDTGFILSREAFPTWWTALPGSTLKLTGWVGGPPALELSKHSNEALLAEALQSLSNILEVPVTTLKEHVLKSFVFNWQKNEFTAGGYSFSTVVSEKGKNVLNTPIGQKIYFAGEALYDGPKPGTVEAALHSAKTAADRILGDM